MANQQPEPEILMDECVVSVLDEEKKQILGLGQTFTIQEANSLFRRHFPVKGDKVDLGSVWLQNGVAVRVLAPGESWRKGTLKLKVVAEFISSEPKKQDLALPKPEAQEALQVINDLIGETSQGTVEDKSS